MTAEHERLQQSRLGQGDWRQWGSYMSEREWGTIREDYSPNGDAWNYLPHDHARSIAYRWGEDGLAGICDRHQQICFALALWNGRDSLLKERLFGVTNPQGNHGEDVKEYYYYLDNTPTHSYMKYLYKYPQVEFPYNQLVQENQRREQIDPEYELIDTGVFDDDRYFDVYVEYAKASPEDILVRLTIVNRGPEEASLDLLPTLWFRNTWSLGYTVSRPLLSQYEHARSSSESRIITIQHEQYGQHWLYCNGTPSLLFTENETNLERLYSIPNAALYVKDGINNYVVHDEQDAVNLGLEGTKVAAHYHLTLAAGETRTVQLRFSDTSPLTTLEPFNESFTTTFTKRLQEANDFYATIIPTTLSDDAANIRRQAFASMLWSKQFYCYDVETWLTGDPANPPPPDIRKFGRNHDWTHLSSSDVIAMADTWEYPWYASWHLAFHCIVFASIDLEFAKEQLLLPLNQRYVHPNGHIPAHEWDFAEASPPVHAWAVHQIYKMERKLTGKRDNDFLEKAFQKLLLDFTWWVNRTDAEGKNVFEGGILGLDNIGIFSRNDQPFEGKVAHSDSTSWIAMYCLHMMTIALELTLKNRAYEDIALKFFEQFLAIAEKMNQTNSKGMPLWDEEGDFFYDVLFLPDNSSIPLKIRSLVGLLPLCAVEILEPQTLAALPTFKEHLRRSLSSRPELNHLISQQQESAGSERYLLALVHRDRLQRILKRMLDPAEFLSDYGVRSLSKFHADHPFVLEVDQTSHTVHYDPGESRTELFGGNTNWRGPIWFSINYLILEALQRLHSYYGDDFKVECPTGSRTLLSLGEVAFELSHRLTSIFLRDQQGQRAVYGEVEKFQHDPHWRDFVLFYEYFHGDTGIGIGASHHTGWTGLVARLLQQRLAKKDIELHKRDLRGADLSGWNLSGTDLSVGNLSKADLSEANLSNTNLSKSDVSEAWLFKTVLSEANLSDAILHKAHLHEANLSKANLQRADLSEADLRDADLSGADLTDAFLTNADLSGAKLYGTDLRGADLSGAKWGGIDIRQVYLSGARLSRIKLGQLDLGGTDLNAVELGGADLKDANLNKANLSEADLNSADLRGVNLKGANLSGANLRKAKLMGANLIGSNVSGADLSEADLTGCHVHAISAWGANLEKTIQMGLIITKEEESAITVDNLEVAQFVYLLLNNTKIRDVINTITSKVILILGRFTPERKVILDALRDAIRGMDYLPIIFDFEKPSSRNTTETVRTLAHLARFIIADLTDPSSIPQELQAIIPTLAVPVQPVLLEGRKEYAMFPDFLTTYHWVLPIHSYKDQASLLSSLKEYVIAPAEHKAQELAKR